MNFGEFMSERKAINRWLIAAIFITGAFAGVLLATVIFIGYEVLLIPTML